MPQCAKMLSRSSGRPYGQACIGVFLGEFSWVARDTLAATVVGSHRCALHWVFKALREPTRRSGSRPPRKTDMHSASLCNACRLTGQCILYCQSPCLLWVCTIDTFSTVTKSK